MSKYQQSFLYPENSWPMVWIKITAPTKKKKPQEPKSNNQDPIKQSQHKQKKQTQRSKWFSLGASCNKLSLICQEEQNAESKSRYFSPSH